jgi:ubiquitin carboxyl-terminal hydrolase 7
VETATEYAGLKNQGATCYLNSLLQTLFHLRSFRKSVYAIPTKEGDLPESCIPLALQRLFYNMERSPESKHPVAVGTKQLTASFGWTSAESFQQHDVQELSRVLCDTLEEKMKGTVVEGALGKLFQGHIVTTTTCTDVPYSSSRTETFLDLQLVVSGCADVAESFGKYCEKEVMDSLKMTEKRSA